MTDDKKLDALVEKVQLAKRSLESIAGGCFQNASTYAVNGQWHEAYQALQEIAADTLAALEAVRAGDGR